MAREKKKMAIMNEYERMNGDWAQFVVCASRDEPFFIITVIISVDIIFAFRFRFSYLLREQHNDNNKKKRIWSVETKTFIIGVE